MIRARPNNGNPAVIVDSDVQSDIEAVMTMLEYGCTEYTLEMADSAEDGDLDACDVLDSLIKGAQELRDRISKKTENRIWRLKRRSFNGDNMPASVASWSEWVYGNPWESEYNKAFGFVVEAYTEQEAREIADREAGEENECEKWPRPWLNPDITVCEELSPTGTARVAMRDFYAEN